jgi:hypothetical protein
VYSFSSMSSPPFGAFEEKQDIDGNRKGISVSGDACAGEGLVVIRSSGVAVFCFVGECNIWA